MRILTNLSIRNKLIGIILVSTVLSLAAGFAYVITTSIQRFHDDLITTTETVTEAVGNYTALPLAFENPEEAHTSLQPLRALEMVTDVYLFDLKNELFDYYSKGESIEVPEVEQEEFSEIRDGYVHCFRPVVFEGDRYGTIYVRASAASLDQQIQQYLFSMGGLGLVLVLFAGATAYGLQGFISSPILELAETARQISSEEADYSVRVRKPGNDEIGELYDGFNEMLSQIQRRQEELERSNRDLDQFAYVASHDLKAPLRAIATLAGWIEEDLEPVITPESREQLQLMQSRVARMDGLIDGILQYSRVGRLESEGEEVDADEMIRELIEVLSPPAGMKVTVGPGMPVFITKRLRLEQVFLNLISNAIKYHDHVETGSIEVGVEEKPRELQFYVKDDGPGIDPRHHDRVFLMFQTLAPRDKVESTGLGLSLVTKLVEEEGGKVWVESEVGQGATFYFTWPKEPKQEPHSYVGLDSENG